MYTKPIILPLDSSGRIYALQDEKGLFVGTGSREVCALLLHILTRSYATSHDRGFPMSLSPNLNVRVQYRETADR